MLHFSFTSSIDYYSSVSHCVHYACVISLLKPLTGLLRHKLDICYDNKVMLLGENLVGSRRLLLTLLMGRVWGRGGRPSYESSVSKPLHLILYAFRAQLPVNPEIR